MEADAGRGDARELIAVGARGTLEPWPGARVLRPGERLAGETLPPVLEALLKPWLQRAVGAVEAAAGHRAAEVAGEPVPLESLRAGLKQRLAELVSPALSERTGGVGEAAFWGAFPALRSLVARTTREWVEGTVLFLQRLRRDADVLARRLGVTRLPAVAAAEATASDPHPRGAVVLKVRFAGGGCVFYKPRAVWGEWLWWALLEAMDAERPLPAARVLPCGEAAGWGGEYGWMESVLEEEAWPAGPGRAQTGARWSYWERAGALLCLAQHLRLTDLHMGNVLATPGGPAVTDAECLGTVSDAASAAAGADERLRATGLLPQGCDGGFGVDSSGLFGAAGAVSGVRVSRWAVSEAGRWRLTTWPAALLAQGNLPAGAPASPRGVVPELLAGYRRSAELLMRARGPLLSAGSTWRRVLETRHAPRCVVRDTLVYGRVLSRSLAARHVRGREGRRSFLEAWAANPAGLPTRVVQAEVRALLAGSVPRLVITAGSRTLRDGEGRVLERNFSALTPAEGVHRELQSLTEARLEERLLPALFGAVL